MLTECSVLPDHRRWRLWERFGAMERSGLCKEPVRSHLETRRIKSVVEPLGIQQPPVHSHPVRPEEDSVQCYQRLISLYSL